MKQGEIWWAELPKPAGRRPVILLSRDEPMRFAGSSRSRRSQPAFEAFLSR